MIFNLGLLIRMSICLLILKLPLCYIGNKHFKLNYRRHRLMDLFKERKSTNFGIFDQLELQTIIARNSKLSETIKSKIFRKWLKIDSQSCQMFTLDFLKTGFSIPLILTAKVIGFGSTSDVHEIDLEFSFKYEICNWFRPKIAENRPNNILFMWSIYYEFFSLFWSVFLPWEKDHLVSRLFRNFLRIKTFVKK